LFPSIIELNTDLAFLLLGVFGLFVLYRSFRLLQAWQTTCSRRA